MHSKWWSSKNSPDSVSFLSFGAFNKRKSRLGASRNGGIIQLKICKLGHSTDAEESSPVAVSGGSTDCKESCFNFLKWSAIKKRVGCVITSFLMKSPVRRGQIIDRTITDPSRRVSLRSRGK